MMALDSTALREQAHAWLDLLTPAKSGAVHSLLGVLLDESETLSAEDRAAIEEGLADSAVGRVHSMEEVLADLGLTMDDIRGPQA